ncbi:MAG: sigma-70 family RNA polymerase sigma factor [Burkholderiales bacterium]|nr:sigma-70 family RNA polymerase sigma factor [Burkholderiales bacterium]MDE2160225.1 sigma-70 family RNA polymerase sigma factor [Burkholderiales bacterium]MDE2501588.1 sigma-70 family RNA polymerase sigma factor [Burkholderiales bacterium]
MPGSMPTNDEWNVLVQAVASRGDRQAYAALFKHFAPRLKSYLLRAGCAAGLAEELTQEAMLKVWRKAATFDPARAQASTWIFTIARHLHIDGHRRQGDAAAAPAWDDDAGGADAGAPEVAADPEDGPERLLESGRREQRVRAALAHLSDEQAQILRRSYFDEQPHALIARDLGLPLGTVKSRIRLALNHLRRLLDGFES